MCDKPKSWDILRAGIRGRNPNSYYQSNSYPSSYPHNSEPVCTYNKSREEKVIHISPPSSFVYVPLINIPQGRSVLALSVNNQTGTPILYSSVNYYQDR